MPANTAYPSDFIQEWGGELSEVQRNINFCQTHYFAGKPLHGPYFCGGLIRLKIALIDSRSIPSILDHQDHTLARFGIRYNRRFPKYNEDRYM